MKIAFILPDLRAGGAEKVCINLATDWIDKGHSITFVLMNKRGEYLKNIWSVINWKTLNDPFPCLPLLRDQTATSPSRDPEARFIPRQAKFRVVIGCS